MLLFEMSTIKSLYIYIYIYILFYLLNTEFNSIYIYIYIVMFSKLLLRYSCLSLHAFVLITYDIIRSKDYIIDLNMFF